MALPHAWSRESDSFTGMAIRKSRSNPDEVLVAGAFGHYIGHFAPAAHPYSTNKYAFRCPPSGGQSLQPMRALRRVDDIEWDGAEILPDGHEEGFDTLQELPRTEKYLYSGYRSASGRRLAILSYGEPGIGVSTFFNSDFFHPPRRVYAIDFHDTVTGGSLGRLRFSCCCQVCSTAKWHGDTLFSTPLSNSKKMMICNFR